MPVLTIILIVAWIYILSVLKRADLKFFTFLIGSVGLFIILIFFVQPIITGPLTKAVAATAGIIGDLTGIFKSYYQYAMLFVNSKGSSISLYIDYECSGVIEIITFTSMLWFFPVYRLSEKLIINILGVIWIFVANIIRILSICLILYGFGNNSFFFAHTIFGRLIFYSFAIILYFYVFTRSQILRQKVGNFKYGSNSK